MNDIKKKTYVFPCIKVSQPLAEFYVISIKASQLCGLTFSVPAEYVESTLTGNQREKKKERIEHISQYVNGNDATFPNSIILSANFSPDGDFISDDELRWYVEDGKLQIPTDKPLASIIDGQHRIDGFKRSFEKEQNPQDMELLCSVFIDLPAPEQAEVFATINYNQQKVDKSLAYQLFGYSLDTDEAEYWAPDTLAIYMSRIFNEDRESKLLGVIKSGIRNFDSKLKKEPRETTLQKLGFTISTAAIVEGVVKLYSSKPIRDRYAIHKKALFGKNNRTDLAKIEDQSPLRNLYIEGHDRQIYDIITACLDAADKHLWSNANSKSRIITTVGILALFDFLKEILLRHGSDFKSYDSLFENYNQIDFSDSFFKTSGAARPQIRNVLLLGYYKNYLGDNGIHEYNSIIDKQGPEYIKFVT